MLHASWHQKASPRSVVKSCPWQPPPCVRAEDITYLIYFILYQYYFAALKLYAMFTLHVTAWGTRAGVGAPDKKDTRDEVDDVEAELARLKEEEEERHKKEETRVKMLRKGRSAQKTYQKGNIALMRRIHNRNQEDEARLRAALACCGMMTCEVELLRGRGSACRWQWRTSSVRRWQGSTPARRPRASTRRPTPACPCTARWAALSTTWEASRLHRAGRGRCTLRSKVSPSSGVVHC